MEFCEVFPAMPVGVSEEGGSGSAEVYSVAPHLHINACDASSPPPSPASTETVLTVIVSQGRTVQCHPIEQLDTSIVGGSSQIFLIGFLLGIASSKNTRSQEVHWTQTITSRCTTLFDHALCLQSYMALPFNLFWSSPHAACRLYGTHCLLGITKDRTKYSFCTHILWRTGEFSVVKSMHKSWFSDESIHLMELVWHIWSLRFQCCFEKLFGIREMVCVFRNKSSLKWIHWQHWLST